MTVLADAALAREFGVRTTTISSICTGKTWRCA